MNSRWLCALSGLVILMDSGTADAKHPHEPKTVLRVPLYPYIPDAAGDQLKAMGARIEAEFERTHPNIDLVTNPSCFSDDFYEPSQIARSLKGEGECGYDVIETDTIILQELVAEGAVRPWPRLPRRPDWHPAGIAASTHPDTKALYGVPHWLCGHFIVSRSEAVRQAQTTSSLTQALDGLGTSMPDMAVNMLGSWNLPSMYLDAWADANGARNVSSAVTTEHYDAAVLTSMRHFAQTCQSSTGNPCVDGTYDEDANFDLPATLFAQSQVDATMGYSERLHVILKNLPAGSSPSDIKLSSAPLGEGNHPVLFTDAYFLGVRCTGKCEAAALEFVEYMSDARTFEWILMSEDASAETRVPRYLLPATLDAYQTRKVRSDAFFPVMDAATRRGKAFPNGGLFNIRKQMRDDILPAITSEP
ncbi:hypothetical protein [Corallococcus sicarius]|uniref:hypothetical protein n=1 Tax=Corallococcus sicarius TaxID=2316726 RepID=UPI001ABFED89|nr:hypothetical protein [Corallococcus sicarius]